MKTLVIHPSDTTTDFLSIVYKNSPWTVVRTDIPESLLKKLVRVHDRIIMMGHGTENGLISGDRRRLVVDSQWVYLLKLKRCVYIWCNADKFVKKYNLWGFYTGMFISEYNEAIDNCIQSSNASIDFSNRLFSMAVRDFIDDDNMLEKVKDVYKSDSCPVIKFNNERLFFKPEED